MLLLASACFYPMTTGKDLLDLGFKSGKWFKEAFKHINAHTMTDAVIQSYLGRYTFALVTKYFLLITNEWLHSQCSAYSGRWPLL